MPAFERQARAFANAVKLPPSRVVVLPIGTASPDSMDSVGVLKDAADRTLAEVEAGLAAPVSQLSQGPR